MARGAVRRPRRRRERAGRARPARRAAAGRARGPGAGPDPARAARDGRRGARVARRGPPPAGAPLGARRAGPGAVRPTGRRTRPAPARSVRSSTTSSASNQAPSCGRSSRRSSPRTCSSPPPPTGHHRGRAGGHRRALRRPIRTREHPRPRRRSTGPWSAGHAARRAPVRARGGAGRAHDLRDARRRARHRQVAAGRGGRRDRDGPGRPGAARPVLAGRRRSPAVALERRARRDREGRSASTGRPQRGDPSPFAVWEGIVDAVRRTAQDRPTLVVLDDLHWADVATLRVLRLLAESPRTVPLMVLCTWRPSPPPEDALADAAEMLARDPRAPDRPRRASVRTRSARSSPCSPGRRAHPRRPRRSPS